MHAFIAQGGSVEAIRAGDTYLDVGTYDGFRAAAVALGGLESHAN